MTSNETAETLTEAVGVFSDAATFEDAIDELLRSGFDRAELSLLAGEHAVADKLGHAYRKVTELEDDLSVPRAAYLSAESRGEGEGALFSGLLYVGAMTAMGAVVASGGTLAAAIAAAAAAGGAGGLVGAVLAQWVSDHHARYLQEQIDHGGLLLWVRTRDAQHERRAVEILKRHSGRDVHVHEFPRLDFTEAREAGAAS